MKKNLLLLIASIMFLSSCRTGSEFTSRRYMKGHYAAKKHQKEKIKPVEQDIEVKSLLASKQPVYTAKKAILLQSEVPAEKRVKNEGIKIGNSKKAFSSALLNEIKNISSNAFKKENPNIKAKAPSTEKDKSLDKKALMGTIFGVAGFVMDIMGFVLFLSTLEYIFMIFFALAVVLGIFAVILGSKGIRRYKEKKNVTSLVFGIIGLATGIISMIMAIYYTLYCLVWAAIATA